MLGWTREVYPIDHRVRPARFVAGLALELHPYQLIVVRRRAARTVHGWRHVHDQSDEHSRLLAAAGRAHVPRWLGRRLFCLRRRLQRCERRFEHCPTYFCS